VLQGKLDRLQRKYGVPSEDSLDPMLPVAAGGGALDVVTPAELRRQLTEAERERDAARETYRNLSNQYEVHDSNMRAELLDAKRAAADTAAQLEAVRAELAARTAELAQLQARREEQSPTPQGVLLMSTV